MPSDIASTIYGRQGGRWIVKETPLARSHVARVDSAGGPLVGGIRWDTFGEGPSVPSTIPCEGGLYRLVGHARFELIKPGEWRVHGARFEWADGVADPGPGWVLRDGCWVWVG